MTDAFADAARTLLDRPGVARLLTALDAEGEETRIAGGAVRNALLGRAITDIDFATTALPAATVARARSAGLRVAPTGIAHGTLTVIVAGEPFEVTTLREDVETDGRHAVVRFGRDFAADAARRDFTVNGLFLDRHGAVHDTVGGLADLAAGRVRFIGDPDCRIREDYLRILRFFRFHADYATGAVDAPGLEAAIAGRAGLARLSPERVRAELLKLVVARRAVETVAAMDGAGLLGRLLGGVTEHGRLRRAAIAGHQAVGRLGALAVMTVEDGERLRERLRLSNAERDSLLTYAGLLSRLRSLPGPAGAADLRRLAATTDAAALAAALAVLAGEPGPVLTAEAAALAGRYSDGSEAAPVFPTTAADLMRLGHPPGPALGQALAAARGRWLAAGCPAGWSG